MDQYHLLPRITFRQLEVLRAVFRERSFSHAALDLHSTRGNVKRMCGELEQILGGVLFEQDEVGALSPTAFAHTLVSQMSPLVRSVRKLEDAVSMMHQTGRVLRLAATPRLFESGWFTGFLRRFRSHCPFRVCCLMLDERRFRTALLNAECDVFLGCGLTPSDKLDTIDLGPVPWQFVTAGGPAAAGLPEQLADHPWWIEDNGDPEAMERLLDAFQQAGAARGRAASPTAWAEWLAKPATIPAGTTLLVADTDNDAHGSHVWPSHHYAAFIRRNHPYSELKSFLESAAHGI